MSSEFESNLDDSLYIDWKYNICNAMLNLFDIAAIWLVLAEPFAEHANDSSYH